MSSATSEQRAVTNYQNFVTSLTASTAADVEHTKSSRVSRIPASDVDRAEVVDVFLQYHPEHEAHYNKLMTVGSDPLQLSDEFWAAAKRYLT
jgi:hypothetical protein